MWSQLPIFCSIACAILPSHLHPLSKDQLETARFFFSFFFYTTSIIQIFYNRFAQISEWIFKYDKNQDQAKLLSETFWSPTGTLNFSRGTPDSIVVGTAPKSIVGGGSSSSSSSNRDTPKSINVGGGSSSSYKNASPKGKKKPRKTSNKKKDEESEGEAEF